MLDQRSLSPRQRAVLRALHELVGDKTLDNIARYSGTTNAGAARTLRSLEDRHVAREQFNGTWSHT